MEKPPSSAQRTPSRRTLVPRTARLVLPTLKPATASQALKPPQLVRLWLDSRAAMMEKPPSSAQRTPSRGTLVPRTARLWPDSRAAVMEKPPSSAQWAPSRRTLVPRTARPVLPTPTLTMASQALKPPQLVRLWPDSRAAMMEKPPSSAQ